MIDLAKDVSFKAELERIKQKLGTERFDELRKA